MGTNNRPPRDEVGREAFLIEITKDGMTWWHGTRLFDEPPHGKPMKYQCAKSAEVTVEVLRGAGFPCRVVEAEVQKRKAGAA